tara:strand:+ start:897 stop:1010 length:114 start_codon:yes stop_codon:yes gene_type:complete
VKIEINPATIKTYWIVKPENKLTVVTTKNDAKKLKKY